MKNSKKIAKILIMLLIICMVSLIAKPVFADDEDIFTNIAPIANSTPENTTQENNAPANATPAENTAQENTTPANIAPAENTNNSITFNNITANNNNTATNNSISTNRSVSNSNSLAKTGVTDSKGFITLVVLICGISAIYSFKKISDYKKL